MNHVNFCESVDYIENLSDCAKVNVRKNIEKKTFEIWKGRFWCLSRSLQESFLQIA